MLAFIPKVFSTRSTNAAFLPSASHRFHPEAWHPVSIQGTQGDYPHQQWPQSGFKFGLRR